MTAQLGWKYWMGPNWVYSIQWWHYWAGHYLVVTVLSWALFGSHSIELVLPGGRTIDLALRSGGTIDFQVIDDGTMQWLTSWIARHALSEAHPGEKRPLSECFSASPWIGHLGSSKDYYIDMQSYSKFRSTCPRIVLCAMYGQHTRVKCYCSCTMYDT